jgi:hypothetical protein
MRVYQMTITRLCQNITVIMGTDANEDACPCAGKRARVLAAVFECFPGQFQKQPMLRIDPRSFSGRDAKKLCVKLIYAVNESAPSSVDLAWLSRISIKKSVNVETLSWDFRNGVNPVAQELPELLWSVRAAGKTAADPNDGKGIWSYQVRHA